MAKIFKLKNFNYFAWTPLGSRVNIFAFKFSLRWLQPDIVPIICCRRCWYRWQFATGVIDTVGKFATGINNTSEIGGKICRRRRWHRWQICRRCQRYRQQFCRRCRWYRRCTLNCDYLREFSKKFETVLMQYSGAGEKLIHQKNQKQKISWHCPFKGAQAWDIRDRVFYTNQACTDRWLGDWRQKLKFRKIELWLEGFCCVYLIKRMISMRLITKKITR